MIPLFSVWRGFPGVLSRIQAEPLEGCQRMEEVGLPVRAGELLRLIIFSLVILAGGSETGMVAPAAGQSLSVGMPLNSQRGSFYQSSGFHWNARARGWNGNGTRVMGLNPQGGLTSNLNFSFRGGNLVPPLGGFNPAAGGRLNVRGRNFQLGLTMAKGSSTFLSMQAPSLMVPNGFGGGIYSGQVRSVVTGFVPVAGGGYSSGYPDNGVTRAIDSGMLDQTPSANRDASLPRSEAAQYSDPRSTALTGDLSVSQIREQRAKWLEQRRLRKNELVREAERLLNQNDRVESRRKYLEALKYADDERTKRDLKLLADSLKAPPRR